MFALQIVIRYYILGAKFSERESHAYLGGYGVITSVQFF